MNGQLPPAFVPTLPAFRLAGRLRAALHPDPEWKRLYAALAASCLLHAAIVVVPYLGGSDARSRIVVRGGQKPAPVRVLEVRLVAEGARAAALPGSPDAAAAVTGEEPLPAPARSLGIDVLPITAPAYYSAAQLTKLPRATSAPRLDVPQTAPAFGAGKLTLKVWINDRGGVDSVEVEAGDVPEEVAGSTAAAFGKLRFVPGEINGKPVGSLLKIEVTYEEGAREDSAQNVGELPPP
jgi:hypothetical protein